MRTVMRQWRQIAGQIAGQIATGATICHSLRQGFKPFDMVDTLDLGD